MPMSAILANCATDTFEPVERIEATGSRRMLAGAESEAGVDLEIDRARRAIGVVHRRMDEEAAGADRLQSRLALRHPVGRVFEMLDLGLAAPELGARAPSAPRPSAGRRNKREVRQSSGFDSVGFVGDDHRRRRRWPGTGPRRRAIASAWARVQWNGDPPAHFAGFLRQPRVERCPSALRIILAAAADRSAAPCRRAGRSRLLALGCGVTRSPHCIRPILAMLSRNAAT